MQLSKYKITAASCEGYALVVYQDNHFKSCLTEFKPPLSDSQLNHILNHITDDPAVLQETFTQRFKGKVTVEPIYENTDQPDLEATEYATNDKIALWCRYYAENVVDELGKPVKYKTGAAESGKLKALAVTPAQLERELQVYFKSDEWYLKPKSISNFIKKYNEVRALVYARPAAKKAKVFPLPYDANFFNNCDTNEKRLYWDHLRANGYKWTETPGRGGKWIKQHDLNA